jgi:hypothetical protein
MGKLALPAVPPALFVPALPDAEPPADGPVPPVVVLVLPPAAVVAPEPEPPLAAFEPPVAEGVTGLPSRVP